MNNSINVLNIKKWVAPDTPSISSFTIPIISRMNPIPKLKHAINFSIGRILLNNDIISLSAIFEIVVFSPDSKTSSDCCDSVVSSFLDFFLCVYHLLVQLHPFPFSLYHQYQCFLLCFQKWLIQQY